MASDKMYANNQIKGENPEKYVPEGFHPVHLGDILNDRYHIFRKLGVGSQSTVWLAHDSNTSTRRYVALKIFGALTSSSEIALKSILQPVSHPGKAHVEVALDSFMVKGIHGEHFCKVLEPLGVCLRDVLEEAFLVRSGLNEPEGWLGRVLEGDKWSGQTVSKVLLAITQQAKRICWQILLGLDYLHEQGVAHRDMQGGNVCLSLEYDLDALSENEIQRAVWPAAETEISEAEGRETNEEEIEEEEERYKQTAVEVDVGNIEEEEHQSEEDMTLTPENDSSDDSSASETSSQKAWHHSWIQGKVLDLASWQALSLSPGSKTAPPHSPEWNKANFLLSKYDIELLRRKDDQPLDPDNIQYTVSPTPLASSTQVSMKSRFVVTDLGFSRAFEECEKYPLENAPDFRCPETLIGIPATHKADIFSLGLLFWEIVFLRRLIENRYKHPDLEGTYSMQRMMRDLAQRLGPVPDELREKWVGWEQWLDGKGRALDPQEKDGHGMPRDEQEEGEDIWGEDVFEFGDIWWQARGRKPLDMEDEEMECFVGMLLSMMSWRAEDRPGTGELLKHKWFEDMR